jgi:Circadian oscillating protein COP23
MKINNVAKLLTATIVTLPAFLAVYFIDVQPSLAQNKKFVCGRDSQGNITTFARTTQGLFPLIVWSKWEPGQWSRQKRCVAIANRFNTFTRSDFNSLRASKKNGFPVICTRYCQKIAITFPKGTNAKDYLEQLKAIVSGANVPALELSNNDAPFSYEDGELVLNMNNLLALDQYLPTESADKVEILEENNTKVAPTNPSPSQANNSNNEIIDVPDDKIHKGPLNESIFK